MRKAKWWLLSVVVSIVLTIVLVRLWVQMNEYVVEHPQLVSEQATDEYLWVNWESRQASNGEPTIKIKTGIFIQSLKFFNSTEVNLTGYIWQRYRYCYRDGEHGHIKPRPGDVGFILPEQVASGSDIEPREIFRVRNNGEEIIGWYFEATLRQPFDYEKYPFDHKTVWVRMWPKAFYRNIILVPDFESYQATGLNDIFGIDEQIVLGTWERENTYFDYHLSSYDNNFGIPGYIGQQGFPELHYNFVVKRKFENAFIVYLLPLLLVATLLFAALLTVTDSEKLSERFGFNASGFIGVCSALFFVVMLAHIQLREQFPGAGIVYIEYFYILMYGLLVMATANVYLFSTRPGRWCKLLLYRDNLLVKVAYWPVVLGCLILITVGVM